MKTWTVDDVMTENVVSVKANDGVVTLTGRAEFGRELGARLLDVVAGRLQAARHRLLDLYAYPDLQS